VVQARNDDAMLVMITKQIIADNMKSAARRSPKCIRKTKKYGRGTAVSVPLPKFCKKNCFFTQNFTEIGQSAAELWAKKNDF